METRSYWIAFAIEWFYLVCASSFDHSLTQRNPKPLTIRCTCALGDPPSLVLVFRFHGQKEGSGRHSTFPSAASHQIEANTDDAKRFLYSGAYSKPPSEIRPPWWSSSPSSVYGDRNLIRELLLVSKFSESIPVSHTYSLVISVCNPKPIQVGRSAVTALKSSSLRYPHSSVFLC